MGSSASTLTPLQSAEVTRLMKIAYDDAKGKKLDGRELQDFMTQTYEDAVTTVTANPLQIIVSNAKRLQRGISKDLDKGKPKQITRRRSFGEKDNMTASSKRSKDTKLQKQGSASNKEGLSESESTPNLGVAEEKTPDTPSDNVDSWDSVSAQPSCMICGMIFPSVQKLNTHTKYSEVHAQNVKKLTDAPPPEEKPKEEKKPEAAGSRCRVLYTGNKLFWRTQITYDIHIYLHIEPKVIEVIPYEARRNTEVSRIFLNEATLLTLIGENTIWDKIKEMKKEATSGRFVKTLPPDNILFDEEKRLAISSYVLSHLKIDDVNKSTSPFGDVQGLLFDAGNPDGPNPLYPSTPENVTPVFIPRRRHSSEDEIKNKITEVNNLQADIRKLSSKAERISNLFSQGMESLKSVLKTKDQFDSYSLPRKRWINSIKRVIRINAVAANTRNMRERFGNKYC